MLYMCLYILVPSKDMTFQRVAVKMVEQRECFLYEARLYAVYFPIYSCSY